MTAVLVSHDGAQWLPDCLAAVKAQTRAPQRIVAVDTGSHDDSPRLLTEAFGAPAVVTLPRDTSFPAAVQAGLDAFAGVPDPPGLRSPVTGWVWLLHDDCAPAPDALARLLAEADASPSLAAIAPKVQSWDGGWLSCVGLTIDTSGHVHTGLEPHEVDQGQHDDVGEVLASSTAGLLVRRDVWDRLGGLDRTWPLFVEDVDFGWRVHAAGERLRVVPAAVMRHASALSTGARSADAVAGRAGAALRRHGMQVVLANTAGPLVPVLLVRYVLECLVRAVVLMVLARRPAAALDEVVALGGLLGRARTLLEARRRRRGRDASYGEIRGLLAGPGLRWRAFTDRVADAFRRDEVEPRPAPRRVEVPAVESGPVAAETESMRLGDAGALLRFLRRPAVLLAVGLTIVGLIADRSILGGDLHGGRLLPSAGGAGDLWSTYVSGWHDVGLGSTRAAPPALAALALLSTLLLGKTWLAVSILMLGAIPLAGLSAYAASGMLTRSPWLRVWASVAWSVLPALTAAIAGGRLDVVVTVILLPLLARAVVAVVRRPGAGQHRAVGAGLLLAVVTAFTPSVWPLTLLAVGATVAVLRTRITQRLRAAAVVLAVPALVLLPWTGSLFAHPRLFVSGLGAPEAFRSTRPIDPAHLLLLRPGGPGSPPLWVLAPLLLAGLLGLGRERRRGAAQVGFATFVLALVGSLLIAHASGADLADPAVRYWPGATAAAGALGLLAAAVVAGDQTRTALRRYAFGVRQPLAIALALSAAAGTATALVAVMARGVDGPLTDGSRPLLPVFAAAEVGRPTAPKLAVLAEPHRTDAPATYAVVRSPNGWRLGDADVAPGGSVAAARLTAGLRDAAAGQAAAVPRLAEFGISMLVVEGAGDALSRLADVDGLDRVPTTAAVVWRNQMPTGELVVLGAGPAAEVSTGADLPADARPRPLPAGYGSARTTLPTGDSGRLLVLAEPASSRWRATLDGTALPTATAYGWAQAWRLPAGGGLLHVSRTGDSRGWWLWGELIAVVLLALLALPTATRRPGAEVTR